MHDVTISFGKVVATPTAGAWSQSYNAGSLFFVLSLGTKEETLLNALGKDIIKSLEEEYFTIEEKNLESIKSALTKSVDKIPDGIEVSFIAATLVKDILYLYLYGGGEIVIRRNNTLGKILASEHTEEKKVLSASGQVENNDAIVLQTAAFAKTIDKQTLNEALSSLLPSDATESLAPKIHEKEAGDASAIILYFKTLTHRPVEEEVEQQQEEEKEIAEAEPAKVDEPEIIDDSISEEEPTYQQPSTSDETEQPARHKKYKLPSSVLLFVKKFSHLSHSRKMILSIVIIVFAVFAISIFFAGKHSENTKLQAEFQAFYPQASDKVKQAQVLQQLNAPLSQEDYQQAQKLLTQNQNKFPSGSKERQQINDLLSIVNKALASSQKAADQGTNKSAITVVVLNGSGVEGAGGKASDAISSLGYNVTGTKNADNYNYSGVTIRVKPDKKAYLGILKKDLSGKYTITSATADLPSSSSEDVDIIVGK